MGRPLRANHKTIGTEGKKDPLRLSGGFSYIGVELHLTTGRELFGVDFAYLITETLL
jgi:hypothetical protein